MGVLFGRAALSSRGRWLAILAATVAMQFSYWPAIFALAAAHADEPVPSDLALFGLAFVPLVFLVLAFGSRNPRAPGSVLKAMALFLAVGAPLALVNPVVGLVAGFGAGGIVAIRRPGLPRDLRSRVLALTIGCVYLFVLLVVLNAVEFAIITGAALPFTVLGIADEVVLGRAEQDGGRHEAEQDSGPPSDADGAPSDADADRRP